MAPGQPKVTKAMIIAGMAETVGPILGIISIIAARSARGKG